MQTHSLSKWGLTNNQPTLISDVYQVNITKGRPGTSNSVPGGIYSGNIKLRIGVRIITYLKPKQLEGMKEALCVYLLFFLYFMFQTGFYAQGYRPFHNASFVTYDYRSLITLLLFWWLPAAVLLRPGKKTILAIMMFVSIATLFYFCLVVSQRGHMLKINDRAKCFT